MLQAALHLNLIVLKPLACLVLALAVFACLSPPAALAQPAAKPDIDRLRRLVEEQEKQLKAARREAAAANGRLEQQLYLYRITLAEREWRAGNVAHANEILDECPPGLRHWEWPYLRRLFHGGLLTLRGQTCVAYSPDGKRLATAGEDHTAKVWDANTGKDLLTLRGHTAHVTAIAFSPDGKRIGSGGGDGTVRVWDAATGLELLTRRNGSWVSGVAFSPDGKRLAAVSGEDKGHDPGDLKVWNAADGKELLSIRPHGKQVLALAFSPDSKRIATGGTDGTADGKDIKIWDAVTGKQVLASQEHDNVVTLAYSPNGKLLASGSYKDLTVRVLDAATGKLVLSVPWTCGYVHDVAFSPAGEYLAAAGGYEGREAPGEIKVWYLDGGAEAFTIRGHAGPVAAVAYRPDGRRLASVGWDHALKVWDATGPQEVVTFQQGLESIADMAYSPDGKRLAVALYAATEGKERGHGLRVWDTATGEELRLASVRQTGSVSSVAFSPDGRRLAYGSGVEVKILDAVTGKELLHIAGGLPGLVSCLSFSPDGKRLAAGTEGQHPNDPVVQVWDASTGREQLSLRGHTDSIKAVTFSPDGRLIASAAEDGTARIWDAATGKVIHTLKGHARPVESVAFSPDGRRLATAGGLAVPGRPSEVQLWDVGSGRELFALKGHTCAVTGVTFHPDGTRLASADRDGTMKLWDVGTGQEVLSFHGRDYDITRLIFSPDGNHLAAAASTGTGPRITMWDATPLPMGTAQGGKDQ